MLNTFFTSVRRGSRSAAPVESKQHLNSPQRQLTPEDVLELNKNWATEMGLLYPSFFEDLAKGQAPQYFWIGCSDARVPPNVVLGMEPGELFVHRNIANCVYAQDLNVLGALQYAVEVLKVKYILVVGHYGCGGVRAAMSDDDLGTLDNWLRPIKELYESKQATLSAIKETVHQTNALVEFNVVKSVESVCRTRSVQNAWKSGRELHVIGWVYSLQNGIIRDLKVRAKGPGDVAGITAILAADKLPGSAPATP
ncbi:hypothetical protein HDU93_004011 [Gonapodya sp. JEL0774]|nr:hypothetical protein HDU93_004011 [Gonapodya sp. JEL0774]